MTDTLEARAIEAAHIAIDDVHDMDVSLQDYATAAARAVLAEIATGAGDAAGLIAQADAALDGVTPGEWRHYIKGHLERVEALGGPYARGGSTCVAGAHRIGVKGGKSTGCAKSNARFIAASRQLVPALRDALAAELARADKVKALVEAARLAEQHLESHGFDGRASGLTAALAAFTDGEPQR